MASGAHHEYRDTRRHRDPNSPFPAPYLDAAPYDVELNPLRNDPRDPRNRNLEGPTYYPDEMDASVTRFPQRRPEYHAARDNAPMSAYPGDTSEIEATAAAEIAPVHVQMREKRQSGRQGERPLSSGYNPRLSQPDPYPWKKTPKQGGWRRYVTLSLWSVSALVMLILANASFAIAFATTGWGHANLVEHETPWEIYGLWQYCTSAGECVVYFDISVIFHVSRAFAVFGLITNATALLDVLSYICVKQLNVRPVGGSVAVLCFVAAGCCVITVVTFVSGWMQFWKKTPTHEHMYIFRLHYSFGLAIAAGGLDLAAGIACLLEVANINEKIKKMMSSEKSAG